MDTIQGKISLEVRRRERDLSPMTDLEAERVHKKPKPATPSLSHFVDSSLWATNEVSNDSRGSENHEELACLAVLAGVQQSPIQQTVARKPDVFSVTRVDYPESYPTPKPRQRSSLPRDFIPPTERRSLLNCPLKHMYRKGEPVKHEDFVIKIFRGYLKALEWVIKVKERPCKGVFAVLPENDAAIALWKEFAAQVLEYKSSVTDLIAPGNLPATDKNRRKNPDRPFRSYSKSFVAYFFQKNGYLIILYSYFCKVVFQASPDGLCKAWKMDCDQRSGHRHNQRCGKRWEALRKYAQKKMLEELGINSYDG